MSAASRKSIYLFDHPLIRRAQPKEAARLTELCLKSKASLGYDEEFMAQCVAPLTITSDMIQNGEYWVLDDEGLGGVVCLKTDDGGKAAEVSRFFIASDKRGAGIGSLLWQKVLSRCRELGVQRIYLTSEPLSAGFYEKLGFVVVGQEASDTFEGRSLPIMERRLEQE